MAARWSPKPLVKVQVLKPVPAWEQYKNGATPFSTTLVDEVFLTYFIHRLIGGVKCINNKIERHKKIERPSYSILDALNTANYSSNNFLKTRNSYRLIFISFLVLFY